MIERRFEGNGQLDIQDNYYNFYLYLIEYNFCFNDDPLDIDTFFYKKTFQGDYYYFHVSFDDKYAGFLLMTPKTVLNSEVKNIIRIKNIYKRKLLYLCKQYNLSLELTDYIDHSTKITKPDYFGYSKESRCCGCVYKKKSQINIFIKKERIFISNDSLIDLCVMIRKYFSK